MRHVGAVGVALAAFALYYVTQTHVYAGDTPLYEQQVVSGEWVNWHHMLVRPLAGEVLRAWLSFHPNDSPYIPLILLCCLFGALLVGLVDVLLVQSGVNPRVAAAIAALVAVSRVTWSLSTTFEVGLFPVALSLVAGILAIRATRAQHVVASGIAQGLAIGFHLIAVGAFPAWLLVFACARTDRARFALTYVIASVSTAAAVYLVEPLLLVHPGDSAPSPVAIWHTLTAPTRDHLIGQSRPVWLLAHGMSTAIVPWPTLDPLVAALAGGAAVAATVYARPLWARWRGAGFAPLLWFVATVTVAWWVEPGNWEYFLAPIVALAWFGAMIAELAWSGSRRIPWVVAAVALLVALGTTRSIWATHAPMHPRPLQHPTG